MRRARALAVWVALSALAAGSVGCTRTLYNFGTVEPGRIYRSAQPSPLFLRYLAWRHGVRTLVNLRGRTRGFESAFAARHGIRLFAFDLSASRPPAAAEVARFLDILSDPAHYPILVHCRNGTDRTGYMIALHRVEGSGWTASRAAREMIRYLQLPWPNPIPRRVVTEGLRQ